MEYYRHLHGPFPTCKSHESLVQLLAVGEPRPNGSNLRINEILHRQQYVFYPKDEVRRVLGEEEVVKKIVGCRCDTCKNYLRMTGGEFKEVTNAILSQERPKIILLAILIYIGRSYLIRFFAMKNSVHDSALALEKQLLSTEGCPPLLKAGIEKSPNPTDQAGDEQEWFLNNYYMAKNLFDPPVFSTSDDWTLSYHDDCRFPFLDDKKHGEGSFGKVYKFNIHPNYLHVDPESKKKDWYRRRKNQVGPLSFCVCSHIADVSAACICSKNPTQNR